MTLRAKSVLNLIIRLILFYITFLVMFLTISLSSLKLLGDAYFVSFLVISICVALSASGFSVRLGRFLFLQFKNKFSSFIFISVYFVISMVSTNFYFDSLRIIEAVSRFHYVHKTSWILVFLLITFFSIIHFVIRWKIESKKILQEP